MQEMLDRSFPGRSSAHIPFSCRLLAYSAAEDLQPNVSALLCMQLDRSRTGTGTGTSRSAAGRGRPGSHSHAQEIRLPPPGRRSGVQDLRGLRRPAWAGRANQRTNVPRRQGKPMQGAGAPEPDPVWSPKQPGVAGAGESFAPSCAAGVAPHWPLPGQRAHPPM